MSSGACEASVEIGELKPGEVRRVVLGSHAIAVYRVGNEVFATDDTCTHMRGRLSDGYLDGYTIECPLHFGKFDIRSGKPLSAPCTVALRCHAVEAGNGAPRVRLSTS